MNACNKAIQGMAQSAGQSMQQQASATSELCLKLLNCRSFDEAMKLQTEYLKKATERANSNTSQAAQQIMSLSKDMMGPWSEQYEAFINTMTKSIRF
jgi:hypothetical protein